MPGTALSTWLARSITMGFALVAPLLYAHAEPLDKAACQAVQAEHKRLVDTGIEDDVKRGPDWGKANLSTARLEDIRHYLDIVEQLKFRCRIGETPIPKKDKKPLAGQQTAGKPAPAVAGAAGGTVKRLNTPAKPGLKPATANAPATVGPPLRLKPLPP